jgi:hypothetical protein
MCENSNYTPYHCQERVVHVITHDHVGKITQRLIGIFSSRVVEIPHRFTMPGILLQPGFRLYLNLIHHGIPGW